MKAPLCWPALHRCIVPGLLINVKCGWGTNPLVLSGANRGRQGALKLSWGPISGPPCSLAVIHTTGLMVSDYWVGYVSVYLHVCILVRTSGMEWTVFLCLPHDWKSLFHRTYLMIGLTLPTKCDLPTSITVHFTPKPTLNLNQDVRADAF